MNKELQLSTTELRARLNRLERVTLRPVPPPRTAPVSILDKYDSLIRRLMANKENSR